MIIELKKGNNIINTVDTTKKEEKKNSREFKSKYEKPIQVILGKNKFNGVNDALDKANKNKYENKKHTNHTPKKQYDPKSKFLTPNEVKEVQKEMTETKQIEVTIPKPIVDNVTPKEMHEIHQKVSSVDECISSMVLGSPTLKVDCTQEEKTATELIQSIEENVEEMASALLGESIEEVEDKYSEYSDMYDDTNFERNTKKPNKNILDNY